MSGILLPRRLRQLPEYATPPQARHHGALVSGSIPVELIGKKARSDSGMQNAVSVYGPVRTPSVRTDSDTYPVSIQSLSDYTVYLYVWYVDGADAYQYLLGTTASGTNFAIPASHLNISSHWGILVAPGTFIDSTEVLPQNQFTAIVVTRKGSTVSLYRDSVLKNTGTDSTAYPAITNFVLNSYDTAASFGCAAGTKYVVAGIDDYAWADGEIRSFSDNPFSVFKAPARRLPVASAATGTVSLTGQSITSSQGTLSPATSIALSGQTLTSSQGTLAPGISKALSGQALTSSQGTLTPNTSVPLSGQALASAQGTLSVSGSADVTLALSGQALTSAQGTLGLTKSGSVALSGQQATTAQGTLAPATTVSVSGQALTASQGTLTPATAVALSGQTLTSSQGTLAPSATGQSITIQLTGQSLVSGQGSLSLDQYIWDTSQGRAQPGMGTFRPLKPNEMSKPEIVVVDIPEEESTYEHHPVSDVKPIRIGPRAGITGIKLPPRRHPGATPAPVQNRDYKALMARAGNKTKTMKLSDFPVKQNKKYLTKTRGPVTLKGN